MEKQNIYKYNKMGQLNQLEKVLDAFENIYIHKKKRRKKLKIFMMAIFLQYS